MVPCNLNMQVISSGRLNFVPFPFVWSPYFRPQHIHMIFNSSFLLRANYLKSSMFRLSSILSTISANIFFMTVFLSSSNHSSWRSNNKSLIALASAIIYHLNSSITSLLIYLPSFLADTLVSSFEATFLYSSSMCSKIKPMPISASTPVKRKKMPHTSFQDIY